MTSARHASSALPPFLQKLRHITETISSDLSGWADDGLSYVVRDSDKFEQALKQHFKGNLQTFVRQLHFYGFRKVESQQGAWSFVHKNFRRGRPDLLLDIKRKSRADAQASAAQVEVAQLRTQVAQLQDVVDDLRTQLDSVLHVLDDAGMVTVSRRKGAAATVAGTRGTSSAGVATRKRTRRAQGATSSAATSPASSPHRFSDDDDHEDDDEEDDDDEEAQGGLKRELADVMDGLQLERQVSVTSFDELCDAVLEPLDAGGADATLGDLDLSLETEELYQSLVKSEASSSSSSSSTMAAAAMPPAPPVAVSRMLGLVQMKQEPEDAFQKLRDMTRHVLPAQQVGAN